MMSSFPAHPTAVFNVFFWGGGHSYSGVWFSAQNNKNLTAVAFIAFVDFHSKCGEYFLSVSGQYLRSLWLVLLLVLVINDDLDFKLLCSIHQYLLFHSWRLNFLEKANISFF